MPTLPTTTPAARDARTAPSESGAPAAIAAAMAAATVSLDELGTSVDLRLTADTEEKYRTLAALLAGKFNETPSPGDSWEGYGGRFTVVEMDGPAVTRVRVDPLKTEDPPGEI